MSKMYLYYHLNSNLLIRINKQFSNVHKLWLLKIIIRCDVNILYIIIFSSYTKYFDCFFLVGPQKNNQYCGLLQIYYFYPILY